MSPLEKQILEAFDEADKVLAELNKEDEDQRESDRLKSIKVNRVAEPNAQ